jgi:translocation and assembly module TamB
VTRGTPIPLRRRPWKRKAALLVLLVLLALAGTAGFLLRTTPGARWLASRLVPRVPGLSLHVEGGSLWRGLHLRHVAWTDGETSVALESVDARWRFSLLPRPRLRVRHLHARGLMLETPPAPAPSEPPPPWYEALDPARRPPIPLPAFRMPLALRIRNAVLEEATLVLGTETQRIHSLHLSADAQTDKIRLREVRLDHELFQAEARGSLRLSGHVPVDLAFRIRSAHFLPPRKVDVQGRFTNTLDHLAFAVRLDGAGSVEARGTLQPLDPRLPLNASLAWTNLAWPLEGTPIAASQSGQLEVDGSLESIAIDLRTNLSGNFIPESQWTLHATGELRQLAIDRLHGDLLDGSIRTDGRLAWTNGLEWTAALAADHLDAAAVHPQLPSPVDAQLTTTGRWDDAGWIAHLDLDSLAGLWRGQPVEITGRVEGSSSGGWRSPGLAATFQDNRVTLAGTYADQMDLSGEIDLPNPGAFLPNLAGRITGAWSVQGSLPRPDATLALDASNVAYGDAIRIGHARLDADIDALAFANSQLRFELDSLSFPSPYLNLDVVHLLVDGTRARHHATLEAQGEAAALSLALAGALPENSTAWAGVLERAAATAAGMDWTLADPLPLHWVPATHQLVAAPHRWRHAQAELSATEPLAIGASGSVQLQLAGFDLAEFHPWLPDDLRLRGTLSATVGVRWAPGQPPMAEVALDLHEAGIHMIVADDLFIDDAPPLDVAFESVSLHARLADSILNAEFTLAAPDLGAANADAQVSFSPEWTPRDWSGNIGVDSLRLDLIRPFVAELRTLSGELNANLQLAGQLRRPLLHGTVSLTNGLVEPAAFPVTLGDLHLHGILHGDRAEVSGGFRSGGGLASLQGEMQLRDDAWKAELRLSGERLELAYGTLATLQASPDLRLRVEPRQVSLHGTVLIPKADIAIQQLPETAVRPSADVRFANNLPDAPAVPDAPPASPWTRSIDLDLQLGDQAAIGGHGITGRLAGNLRVLQENHAVPRAFGELRIEDGRYRAYGQRLQIRRGQFLFAGPIDQPSLSIEAIRDVPAHNVVAGLRVEGHPDALQSSLFSEPAMPEEDVLAFLLLGRPLSGGEDADSSALLARAAIALGIAGGGGTVTAFAENLGIDQFQLDTAGEGDGTQVVVSGYVSSRLQLSYGVGVFVPANTLTLRYRLARNLFLEAASGLESALDLLYTFRF